MKHLFVNIILPVPIKRVFTYSVPIDLVAEVEVGKRAKVSFGRNKIKTGLIINISENVPQFKTKPVLSILDDNIIVNILQLKMWEWMSSYYLCGMGDIMKAALPVFLKSESKTRYILNPEINDWNKIIDILNKDVKKRSKQAKVIIDKLHNYKAITQRNICSYLEVKQVKELLKWMLSKEWILREERFKEKNIYLTQRALKVNYKMDNIESILSDLKRAKKQEEIIKYLSESGIKEIFISELKKYVSCSESVIQSLHEKGYISIFNKKVESRAENDKSELLPDLSQVQQKALGNIVTAFTANKVCLLKGVTSSGKTCIYFHLIKTALDRQEQVLYLLPEISITTQIIKRVQRHFGIKVWVYHSKLNNRERALVWQEVLSGSPGIIIGVRSSVFLPFKKLGLIIVDEEHDFSYKQQDPSPRYNARDVAVVLGSLHRGNVILGSATPSIESLYNVKRNKYSLVEINTRYGNIELPEVVLVGLKNELKKGEPRPMLSKYLLKGIKESLNNNMQVILFQNRRGYVPYLICEDCGEIPKCIHCDISLTYHKHINALSCHYCGYKKNAVAFCNECESNSMKSSGFGTEKIEEYLQILFPDHNIKRLDLDTTRAKHGFSNIIRDFEQAKIDILIGTQMVTKGLDFENVSLVGILNAESLMNFPDFRANERAFNMMLQVAGRAGRKKTRGKVMIQAIDINDRVLQLVLNNELQTFMQEELEYRKAFLYPPYCRLIKVYFRSQKQQLVNVCAEKISNYLKALKNCEVLGPEMAVVSRVKDDYVKQILIKMIGNVSTFSGIKKNIEGILASKDILKKYKSVKISVDVDPI